MTAQITGGATLIAPTTILGYSSVREAGTLVHPILGGGSPDVTLRPAQLRSGTLSLAFLDPATSEADSREAESVLSGPVTFTLVESDRATLGMAFVVSGQIRRELDPETRADWTVEFDYTEVAP